MKDNNLTPGQFRFIWRFLETRALVITAGAVGFAVGLLAGHWWG